MLQRKTFYFLRHGETNWNVARRLQGQTDIPLNDHGRAQASAVSELVLNLDIDKFCVSQLSRAYETAQLVKADSDMPIEIIDKIKEVTIGERDGQQTGEWYLQWKAGEIVIPGAETRADFRARVIEGVNIILDSPKTALIVSHGGVYGALKESITIKPDVAITNCMLLRLDPDPSSDTDWLVTVLSEPFQDQ
jgi:probable phosphoglycerate mutase